MTPTQTPDSSVRQSITAIAYAVAIVVAVAVPIAHFLALYKFEQGALTTLTRAKAQNQSEQHINRNPALWRFEEHRLQQAVRLNSSESPADLRYAIRDLDGSPLSLGAESPPAWPVMVEVAPLHDSGQVVGYFQTERSLRDVLLATLMTALGSVLLAMAIAVALKTLPLRALRLSQERLAHMAHHDVLTGLPNRSLLNDRLDQAIRHCRRSAGSVTIVFLDLDNFKSINDSLGHKAGDQLLRTMAARMIECVRTTDTVARLGGDEFVIVLFDQPAATENITSAMQRLQAAISEPLQLEGHSIQVTASIGIAAFPGDGDTGPLLLMHADAAMYAAKAAGRDNFQCFTADLKVKANERLAMQEALLKASTKNQFFLVYQPQVDLESRQVFAVEALIRWMHPERGLVSPADFIPIAEASGLIVQIGDWVLRTACQQNRRWQDEGMPPINVSVNVSARQFKDEAFVDRVAGALRDSGLDPQYLELELTESLIMQDINQAIATMHRLDAMGVKLSIDDFGTGYSSLSALKHFPVTRLKIDQSFVREVTDDENDKSIIRAVIAMGHGLNLMVIAEGVETREQLDFLRENQCDEVQGYLFSKPIQAAEIPKMLAQHQKESHFNFSAQLGSTVVRLERKAS